MVYDTVIHSIIRKLTVAHYIAFNFNIIKKLNMNIGVSSQVARGNMICFSKTKPRVKIADLTTYIQHYLADYTCACESNQDWLQRYCFLDQMSSASELLHFPDELPSSPSQSLKLVFCHQIQSPPCILWPAVPDTAEKEQHDDMDPPQTQAPAL